MTTEVQQHQIARVIPARFVAAYQRRHVVLFNIVPIFGTLIALTLLTAAPIGWIEVTLLLVFWAATLGLGGTVGLHRYFTHRSFETVTPVKYCLAVLGSWQPKGH